MKQDESFSTLVLVSISARIAYTVRRRIDAILQKQHRPYKVSE